MLRQLYVLYVQVSSYLMIQQELALNTGAALSFPALGFAATRFWRKPGVHCYAGAWPDWFLKFKKGVAKFANSETRSQYFDLRDWQKASRATKLFSRVLLKSRNTFGFKG
jgi:hypothetical protein